MKRLALIYLLLNVAFLAIGQTPKLYQKIGRSIGTFFNGFIGTVYRTDGDLNVVNVNDGKIYTIEHGTKYRRMDEDSDYLYLKALGKVEVNVGEQKISECFDGSKAKRSDILYKVELTNLKVYEKIWQQGLSWNAMMLPIKYRPAIKFNGLEYEKEFSTDVSIGQFLGYRFKVGKSYTQFFQIGGFAGPTLIQFPTIVTQGNPSQGNVSNENLIGFTYGGGAVFQFEKFQIGLLTGVDNLGGPKSKQWQYDNKRWYSFAIGYKFFEQ